MEYKLTVEEQPEIEEKPELTETEVEGLKNSLIGELTELVKNEWDTVNKYKDAISSMNFANEENGIDECEQIISILEDIEEEEMVHIGQLQTALSLLTNTSSIEVGKMEGEQQVETNDEDLVDMEEDEFENPDQEIDDEIDNETEPDSDFDDEDIIVDERYDKHTKDLYRELSDYDEF